MQYELHFVETIDSTNTALKALARSGAPEGYVLTADRQPSGRGRMGRSFFSPAGAGLYTSILLRPKTALPPASLTCLCAVAAAETVRSYGRDCRIKWVNDLFLDARKVAGILVEGALDPDGTYAYAVVGLGVNFALPQAVPPELSAVIGSVFDAPLSPSARGAFLRAFLDRFGFWYDRLPETGFLPTYRALQTVFGRRVAFAGGVGMAESIDDRFRLIVRTQTGRVALERGEVTFLD